MLFNRINTKIYERTKESRSNKKKSIFFFFVCLEFAFVSIENDWKLPFKNQHTKQMQFSRVHFISENGFTSNAKHLKLKKKIFWIKTTHKNKKQTKLIQIQPKMRLQFRFIFTIDAHTIFSLFLHLEDDDLVSCRMRTCIVYVYIVFSLSAASATIQHAYLFENTYAHTQRRGKFADGVSVADFANCLFCCVLCLCLRSRFVCSSNHRKRNQRKKKQNKCIK